MRVSVSRWEHGSEFHWIWVRSAWREGGKNLWPNSCIFVGSGRDALRLLYRYGRAKLGWKRAIVPSFLCQEVVGAINDEGLAVAVYMDDPREPIHAPNPGRGDALLIVNTFGLRPRWTSPGYHAGEVIEDHTHDPWSTWAKESRADYCVASLRKTLPIPDGGMLWSPVGLPLPEAPDITTSHEAAATRKLEAMIIKSLFLSGYQLGKTTYRSLAEDGETGISSKEISAIIPISAVVVECFDITRWRQKRYANYRLLADQLADCKELSVLQLKDQGSCPFSVVLVCQSSSTREHLRHGLLARRVYPAVLWSLEKPVLELPSKSIELSRRLLSIHCDGRYNESDLVRVADAVFESLS